MDSCRFQPLWTFLLFYPAGPRYYNTFFISFTTLQFPFPFTHLFTLRMLDTGRRANSSDCNCRIGLLVHFFHDPVMGLWPEQVHIILHSLSPSHPGRRRRPEDGSSACHILQADSGSEVLASIDSLVTKFLFDSQDLAGSALECWQCA